MTVSVTTVYVDAAALAATIPFNVPHFSVDDVKVYEIDNTTGAASELVRAVDYEHAWTTPPATRQLPDTATITPGPSGAPTTVPVGKTWRVIRRTQVTQETGLTPGDPFPAAALEGVLDKQTLIAQEAQANSDTTVKAPDSEWGVANLTLPSIATRAGKYLTFGADGSVAASDAAISVYGVSIYFATLISKLDAKALGARGAANYLYLRSSPYGAGTGDSLVEVTDVIGVAEPSTLKSTDYVGTVLFMQQTGRIFIGKDGGVSTDWTDWWTELGLPQAPTLANIYGYEGRLYVDTTTKQLKRGTGGAWETISAPASQTYQRGAISGMQIEWVDPVGLGVPVYTEVILKVKAGGCRLHSASSKDALDATLAVDMQKDLLVNGWEPGAHVPTAPSASAGHAKPNDLFGGGAGLTDDPLLAGRIVGVFIISDGTNVDWGIDIVDDALNLRNDAASEPTWGVTVDYWRRIGWVALQDEPRDSFSNDVVNVVPFQQNGDTFNIIGQSAWTPPSGSSPPATGDPTTSERVGSGCHWWHPQADYQANITGGGELTCMSPPGVQAKVKVDLGNDDLTEAQNDHFRFMTKTAGTFQSGMSRPPFGRPNFADVASGFGLPDEWQADVYTYTDTNDLTGQGGLFYMESTTTTPEHKRSCIWVSVESSAGPALSLVTYVQYWIDNRGRFD